MLDSCYQFDSITEPLNSPGLRGFRSARRVSRRRRPDRRRPAPRPAAPSACQARRCRLASCNAKPACVSNCCALPQSWRFMQAMPARYCRLASRGLFRCADSMRASQSASTESSPASSARTSFTRRDSPRLCGLLDHALPDRQQPGARQRQVAAQRHHALRRMDRDLGHLAFARPRTRPRPAATGPGRARPTSSSVASPRTMLCAAASGEGAVLGQQPRGFQRLERAPILARGLQAQAQGQRAPLRALRQFLEPRQRRRRVAVVQRPAGGAQLHAFARFGAGAARRARRSR